MIVTDNTDANWWRGTNHRGEGLFPAHLVMRVELRSALLRAAKVGDERVVELLLQHKDIEVNVADFHNSTPIGLAAEFGHHKVVEQLLEKTSAEFINKADNDGDYPLTMAGRGGHERVVELLLRHPQIDLKVSDSYGRTALERARFMGNTKLIKLLNDKKSGK